MHSKQFHLPVIFLFGFVMCSAGAIGQAKPGVHILGKTDAALSFYGTWSQSASGTGATEYPADAAGGMFELRHISNPLMGFEGTYSFHRANEVISPNACPGGGPGCQAQSVHANAHELTADWVPSVKLANVRPFAILGVGALVSVPNGGQSMTRISTTPLYAYGAGLDWGLLPHIGLRLQYRGTLYKAPDVTRLFTSVDKFMHTSEPMAGVYFRF